MRVNSSKIRHVVSLVSVLPLLVCGSLVVQAEDVSPSLTVILKGEGELECAPHEDGNVYAPDVVFHDNLYRMWYGAQGKDGHDRILYAESPDGENWVRKGVAIDNGDANHVNDPTVVVVDGRYYMYYTRAQRDVIDRIDLAISDDGLSWSDQGVVLDAGPEGSWDGLSVGRPTVLYEDGKFHLWYDGRKDFSENAPVKNVPTSANSRRAVGYATSTDGIHWQRHSANPVFGNNAGGIDVARFGEDLLLFYEWGGGTRMAVSKDGIRWQDHGMFVQKTGGDADKFGHVTPQLVVDEKSGQIELFVGNAPDRSWNKNQVGRIPIERDFLERILLKY